MFTFYLYLAFVDGSFSRYNVTKFSDLSTSKSDFYYYELITDPSGKGTCVPRSSVLCFVCSPCLLPSYDSLLS